MSHIANTLQNCFQPTAGYPFVRGQWVGPTVKPAEPVPPMARSYDTVNLSCDTANHNDGAQQPGCVTVKSGDSLSQLLMQRGYSLKEMYQKDEQGKTLIDRVSDSNGLRNPNLIFPGQELNLPGKDQLEEMDFPGDEHSCCCDEPATYGPQFFHWAPTYNQFAQPWQNTPYQDYGVNDYVDIPQELFL